MKKDTITLQQYIQEVGDALESFHKQRGTYCKDGFLFVHTLKKEASCEVGDLVKNFY